MTNTRKMALAAILSAVSFLLMFYKIPLVIDFFKLDFSIIPILLALVLLGYKYSIMVVLPIRTVLDFAFNNSGVNTMIGLPINTVAVAVFVSVFALLWTKKRTWLSFGLASLLGTVALTLSMVAVNFFYAIPLYARFANIDIAGSIGTVKYLSTMVVPFNLLEGVIWALAFGLVYRVLTPLLQNYEK